MSVAMMERHSFDLDWIRAQFPSLAQDVNGGPAVFLDGPAGTQVPSSVMLAVQDYFARSNANRSGAFETSRRNEVAIQTARAAVGDLLNCGSNEIVFGQNMTSIAFALSRAIGRELQRGDEIIVTVLDHDANVSPWCALEEKGVVVRKVDIHEGDCTLDLEDFANKLNSKTKLVAVTYASNAVGTINPVATITQMSHDVGAMVFVDAVHYAAHGAIDVRLLDCDFLACSAYKFYGPHVGILYGKAEYLTRLKPYKIRAASDQSPDCWETGTRTQELLPGVTASIGYLEDLGKRCNPSAHDRRAALVAAFQATAVHERRLVTELIAGLSEMRSVQVYGITNPRRFEERCSTVAIRASGHSPRNIAKELGNKRVFTWDGNFYALNLTERLKVEQVGGLLRIGLVHYNSDSEVQTFLTEFARIIDRTEVA